MNASPIPEQIETVIIGAGQAGLATAYHLRVAAVHAWFSTPTSG